VPRDRDHHDDEIALPGKSRDERGREHLAPGQAKAERRRDIGEQHQRQHLHVPRIRAVGDDDLRGGTDAAERQGVDHRRPADQEPDRFAHGRDVGGNIDGIGGRRQRDDPVEQHGRQHFAQIGGEAAAGDRPDARAHDLDRDHEWGREKHGPAQRVAELGPALRVGRDSAGIVVCRPRQQARSELTHQSFQRASARHPEAFRCGSRPQQSGYAMCEGRAGSGMKERRLRLERASRTG
jgi:hypothetical protein